MELPPIIAKVAHAFTFAAPRARPPGLDRRQPYEPAVDGRAPGWVDWVPNAFTRTLYDLPGVTEFINRRASRSDEKVPMRLVGTPGAKQHPGPDATRVAVIGDFGEGTPAQRRIARQLAAWAPDRVATVGDNVYPVGRERDWAEHFDAIYDPVALPRSSWRPALGNHDYYDGDLLPYFDRFPQLAGAAYYDWSSGPVQFLVLDTEQRLDPGSAQYRWLEAKLAASRSPLRVVQLHRPVYSSSENLWAQGFRAGLGPLLARHGVDLVLQGHEHGYERSQAIDGVTYVVTGGGGSSPTPRGGGLPARSVVRGSGYNWVQLAIDGTKLVANVVDDYGRHVDGFTIPARAATAGAAAGPALLATS